MRENIHPKYYPNAQVVCSCGNTWTTGSTREMIRTDVCSNCHPFFTGEQRIVDSAGQVDRFMKRLDRYGVHQEVATKRQQDAQEKQEQRFLKQKLVALELSDPIYQVLQGANVVTIGDALTMLGKGKLAKLPGVNAEAVDEVKAKIEEAKAAFFEA
jgi:large subunit ribosomal protein L31